jgi:hypothetical protein
MIKTGAFILFLSAALPAIAQSNDLPQRKAYKLKVAVDEVEYYQAEIAATAYVLPDNTIQLYPGEKIFVEVEMKRKKIKSMKSVKENLHPEKTIAITFSQQSDGGRHMLMILKIENPFKNQLKYRARVFLQKHNKWITTDVLPVKPMIIAYEHWPDVIVTIAMDNWEFK